MRVIKEWNVKIKLVRTKRGAILHMIELKPGHFFLEQNPLKPSKYGEAYRKIKQNFPEFYFFWEIRIINILEKSLPGHSLRRRK